MCRDFLSRSHPPPLKELDLVQGRGTGGEVDRGNVPRLSQPLTPPPLKELNLVQGRGTGGEVDRGNVP